MSWTSPFTAVVGALIASADWNASGRDNLSWLKGMLAGTVSELVSPKAWGDRPVLASINYSSVPADTGVTFYTVPAGKIALLTRLHLANDGAAPAFAYINSSLGWIIRTQPLAASSTDGDYYVEDCWVVLTAGQVLQAYCDKADSLTVVATIYEVPVDSGVVFRQASIGAVPATTFTTVISPSAGKTLRVRYANAEIGASLGAARFYVQPGAHFRFFRETGAANAYVAYKGEVIVPDGGALRVYGEVALTNVFACGEEF